ncbi:NUDIX domain-containing protein [Nocardioides sp. BP30]|uniref:NUDIX hydrolase n=1 Tax=Nocardioides sp. BP30 TaxID=3036374 RepID=UPI0024689B03|nr:NUDIX domain-containing protein [Nocardioides sp. BP30]WGL52287.1 NUDIX domain-containing protein [Nocardioides sp. BP30]
MTHAPDPAPHYTAYDTRLAAYAVIVRASSGPAAAPSTGPGEPEVLLALWNEEKRKRWTLPGGGVELHETVEEGAVREVREETGYDVELTGLLGIETDVFDPAERRTDTGRSLKAVRVFFSARIVGGALANETDGTTDEARWVPLAAVADLPHTSMVDTGLRLSRAAAG